jgi:hypothetical protein
VRFDDIKSWYVKYYIIWDIRRNYFEKKKKKYIYIYNFLFILIYFNLFFYFLVYNLVSFKKYWEKGFNVWIEMFVFLLSNLIFSPKKNFFSNLFNLFIYLFLLKTK